MVDRSRATTSRQALREARYSPDGHVLGHRPTESYLNALLQQGWEEQEPQRRLDTYIEQLLDDEHDLGLPDLGFESEEVKGGWALELVQRIKGFWPNAPIISVPTLGAGEDPENFANDLEAALNALIAAQSKAHRGPGGSFYQEVKQQVVGYGRGFGVLHPDPSAWPGYPACPCDDDGMPTRDPKRAQSYLKEVEDFGRGRLPPLQLRALPARRVLPFFDSKGLAECFWLSSERAWEVMARAQARGVSANRTLAWLEDDFEKRCAQEVTCIYYANRHYCAELVGTPKSFPPGPMNPTWLEDVDLLGEPYPHWIDRLPVAYFPGMTTPLSARHKRTVSVVYQERHIITMLDRIASQKATAVRTWAWPTPVLKTSLINAGLVEAGQDGRPKPIEITPGLVVTLWGDEELSFLTYTGNGPDSGEMIQLLERQFNRLGLPAVEGQDGLSGYLYAQFRAAVRGKYADIQLGLAQGWEDLAWVELEYLKQMPSTIWVPTVAEVGWAGQGLYADSRTRERTAYLRVKPEQIRTKTFQLEVSLEPDKTLDMVANAQTANMLIQMRVPRRIVYEDVLGLKNTSQIKMMQWVEELEDTPEYKQAIFGAALQQGRILIEQEAAAGAGKEMTLGDLLQYSPGMIRALGAAGFVDPALVEQAMQVQAQNIGMGQVQGAVAGGGLPPETMMGPTPAPGGNPSVTPMQGGAQAMGMSLPGAPPLGGLPSPVVSAPPAAPMPPRPRGHGRAAGQSRAPYHFEK